MGLLGLGAFAALAGGFLLVRKLMDTQLPKVQKVRAAASWTWPLWCCLGLRALHESSAHTCCVMRPFVTALSWALHL